MVRRQRRRLQWWDAVLNKSRPETVRLRTFAPAEPQKPKMPAGAGIKEIFIHRTIWNALFLWILKRVTQLPEFAGQVAGQVTPDQNDQEAPVHCSRMVSVAPSGTLEALMEQVAPRS